MLVTEIKSNIINIIQVVEISLIHTISKNIWKCKKKVKIDKLAFELDMT